MTQDRLLKRKYGAYFKPENTFKIYKTYFPTTEDFCVKSRNNTLQKEQKQFCWMEEERMFGQGQFFKQILCNVSLEITSFTKEEIRSELRF